MNEFYEESKLYHCLLAHNHIIMDFSRIKIMDRAMLEDNIINNSVF